MTKKKKGFIGKWMDKVDKKMESKAKNTGCCCCGDNSADDESCCN